MKSKFILFFTVVAIVIGPTAMAGENWTANKHRSQAKFVDHARVIKIEPIYRTVRISLPEQECWQEKIHTPVNYRSNKHSTGSMVVGGIIGGVVGRQVGHGKSRDIATVAGSVIGATIGHNLANNPQTSVNQIRYERRCKTHARPRSESRLDGYWVTYRYKGEIFTTRMDERPGRRIRVMVNLMPIQD